MAKNFLHMIRSWLSNKDSQADPSDPKQATLDFIWYRMQSYMHEQKPFLNPYYKLKDLSADLNIPLYQVSAYLNKKMGMHFNEYLNQFRIEHCKTLINEAAAGTISLKELGHQCGFHNRNTFRMAFKKFTGKTPSEYVRTRPHV